MHDHRRQELQRTRREAMASPGWRMFGALLAAWWLVGFQTSHAQESGKEIFQKVCAACHSIGGGRLVGPDLAGVNDNRPEDWLIKFIKSSQALVNSGDKTAAAIFEQYNKMPMPDQALSDDQIRKVLSHIKEAGGGAGASKQAAAPSAQEVASAAPPHPDDVQLGQELFEGRTRFAKGGPSCNACHDVRSDKVAGGGILAAELTLAFSRMGKQGMQSVLSSAPFPVMQTAYQGKELSEKEISALIAFLQHVEKDHSRQMSRETGTRMFSAGVGGVVVLLGIFTLAGRRRKRQCVNQDIYDRQIRSE